MKLKVTEINTKAAKYLYEVIDETGRVLSSRKSNREYVACTSSGGMYFGRLDLIGKGDHGRALKYCNTILNTTEEQYMSKWLLSKVKTYEQFQQEAREGLERLTTIAYL